MQHTVRSLASLSWKRLFLALIAIFFIALKSLCLAESPHISVSSSDPSVQVTALIHVRLVPMTEEKVVEDQTVLVKGKAIVNIGPSTQVNIPEDALVIDGAGAYLLPGLADMHMHTRLDWLTVYPVSPLNLYLANGVTTIRCFGPLGESGQYVLDWREAIGDGKRIGPFISTSGPILYGPVENPREVVRMQKAQGFDFIKLYSFLSQKEFQEAISAALQLEFYTAGHIPFAVGLDGVLAAGMDEIAHIEELDFEFLDFDRGKTFGRMEWFRHLIEQADQQFQESFDLGLDDLERRYGAAVSEVANKIRSARVPVCTTLVVGQGIVHKLFESEGFLARPETKYLPPSYLDTFRRGQEKHQVMFKGHEAFASFKYKLELLLLRKLKQAGVVLLVSTDAGTGGMGIVPGFSLHDELQILADNGWTPYEAIAAGTVKAARVVKGMTGRNAFGTIERGKRADLILVKENPLEDVAHLKELSGVMAAGKWYDSAALLKMIALPDQKADSHPPSMN